MTARVSATDAKNNFGGLLELVTARGRVSITKHGRVVAVMMSPRLADSHGGMAQPPAAERRAHMIPPEQARAARLVRPPHGFDDP